MYSKIAIIVPCYNNGEFLRECLESVEKQTFQDWTCIVVNDGSTDDTEQVAQVFLNRDSRFDYLFQENKGLAAARNAGIACTSSEFILPLDADDMLEHEYVEKVISLFSNHPEIKIAYSNYRYFGEKNRLEKLPTYSINRLVVDNLINATAIYRRVDFEKTSGYDSNLKGREDWDFWLSLLDIDSRVARVEEHLFLYRQRPNSMNKSITPADLKEIRCYVFNKHQEKMKLVGGFNNVKSYLRFHVKRRRKMRFDEILNAVKRKVKGFFKVAKK